MTIDEKKACTCYRCVAEVECERLRAELRAAVDAKQRAEAQAILIADYNERKYGDYFEVSMERDALRAELRAAADALRPFAQFAAKWNAKPLRGIDDEVYSIHIGYDAASLRLSDCRTALAIVAAYDAAHPEGQ